MARAITIAVTLILACIFAWAIPLLRLYDTFQPLSVAVSIMVAAVFVRLNLGMPTLEWKSVDPAERNKLTSAVLAVTIEYAWIIGVNATALAGLVALLGVGRTDASSWPEWGQRLVSGVIGGAIGLCVARMGYVVWRDIDIVRTQKHLVDATANKEIGDGEQLLAEAKIARIRSADIRPIDIRPPKAWGE